MCISCILLLISVPLFIANRRSEYPYSEMQAGMEENVSQVFQFKEWLDLGLSADDLLPLAGLLVVLMLSACFALWVVNIVLAVKTYKLLSTLTPPDAKMRKAETSNSERAEIMPSDTERWAAEPRRVGLRGTQGNKQDTYPANYPPASDPPVPPPAPAWQHKPAQSSALTASYPVPAYPYTPARVFEPPQAYSSTPVPLPTVPPMTPSPANPFMLQPPASHPVTSPLIPFHEHMKTQPLAHPETEPLRQPDRSVSPESGYISMRMEKPLDTFTGTTDLKDWLCHFNIIAKHNGWSETERGSHLASALRGSALQVLDDLLPQEQEDHNCIIQALRKRFEPDQTEGLKRREFRDRVKKKDETLSHYGYALRRLAKQAFPTSGFEALEMLVVDQYVEGLYCEEIKKQVMYKRPKNLDEAIAAAMEYENVEGWSARRKPEDQSVRSPAEERKEETGVKEIAEEIGLAIANKLLPTQHPPPPFLPGVWCHRCGYEGHAVRSCPNPRPPPKNPNGRH